ncbi:hypothetical protein I3760_01G250300 [Carya illinoinensis]|nr:hypothetical protein I3760_01G250300 [Carya illinoinensis]
MSFREIKWKLRKYSFPLHKQGPDVPVQNRTELGMSPNVIPRAEMKLREEANGTFPHVNRRGSFVVTC